MPTMFGPWQLVGSIGEGGMGHVFQVRHAETGELGALKRLKNPRRRGRFENEVKAVALLNHPGIVRLIDFNITDEPLYAVYEFEPGGSLGQISTEDLLSIPLSQRLMWCEQLCTALEAAHAQSLIHRDIKPDNILISADRRSARLCDFGLVYFDDDGERCTETMEQVGSRFYIAPECEEGRAELVGPAIDLYSLGKVLYYVARGTVYAREQHRKPKNDLAILFANPYLEALSRIFDEVVTGDPTTRLSSAATLRGLIEMASRQLENQQPIAGVPATYACTFCAVGHYKEVCISSEGHNSGYREGQIGGEAMVFLECDNCGNCQRFKLKYAGDKWFPNANARQAARR